MSIVVQIETIETRTQDEQRNARVTGIDLTSGDTFRGEIEYAPGEWRTVRWRSNGNMRDGPVAWNLNMSSFEMKKLYEAATKLNARLN